MRRSKVEKEEIIVRWWSRNSPLRPRPEIQGICLSEALLLGDWVPSALHPCSTSPFSFLSNHVLDLALGPSAVFLPVSSILATLSGWSGSLVGASPLNPSRGHGGGLGSCTSCTVGHRWAEEEGLESILQVTEIMNI